MQGTLLQATAWRLAAMVLVLGLSGCGTSGSAGKEKEAESEEAEKAEEAPVRLVGEIASVHSEQEFVLIRRYAQGRFNENELLASMRDDGTTSSLRLTGERLGRYYAADIQEGNPEKGDLVIVRRLPEEAVTPSTPVPQGPRPENSAPWENNFPGP